MVSFHCTKRWIIVYQTLTELLTFSISLYRDVFTALAAGTIIYVVCFEIMQRERSKVIKPKIVQFLAMVAGFATMMTVDLTRKLKMRLNRHA